MMNQQILPRIPSLNRLIPVGQRPVMDNDADKGSDDDDNSNLGIATKTRAKTKKPSPYKVLILNDD